MISYLRTRGIARRLVVNGTLELLTATHLGGTDSMSLTDQPILRDSGGKPFIPGTTLAGLLRSHLWGALKAGRNERPVSLLLGCTWGKDNEDQSPLIIEDACMLIDGVIKTELRDGVKIDAASGTAEEHKKFDFELLPMGTRFRLRFELLLNSREAEDAPLVGNFLWLLQELETGHIALGGRTRRGFGRCRASGWTYFEMNVSGRNGLFQWLGMEGGVPDGWPQPVKKPQPEQRNGYTIENMAQDMEISIPPYAGDDRLRISLTLKSFGSLLIRSDDDPAGEADAVHLHRIHQSNNSREPIVSGTSLAGVLRNRALRILNTLSEETIPEEVKTFMDGLFGPEMGKGNDTPPRASRIRTEESVIEGEPKTLRHTRTAIDRWRGGALENMMIQEDALFGGTVTLVWDVLRPPDIAIDKWHAEIGLCLCLVRDLFTGDLPIGGESSIGRGTLYGLSGTVCIPSPDGETQTIRLQGDGKGNLTDVQDDLSIYFKELNQLFLKEASAHAA